MLGNFDCNIVIGYRFSDYVHQANHEQRSREVRKGKMISQAEKELSPLLSQLRQCQLCSVRKEARCPVPPVGRKEYGGVMIVGRNPGREEDEQGEPFVGESGKFLNQFLDSAGFSRSDVYITNCVKCHTRANREPDIIEIVTCSNAYLKNEIEILKPCVILTLGADAFRGVAGYRISNFMENTGRIIEKKIIALPHPSPRNRARGQAFYDPWAMARDMLVAGISKKDMLKKGTQNDRNE